MRDRPERFAERIEEDELLVDDRFDSGDLDRSVWLPYYLPQWSGRNASEARYRLNKRLRATLARPTVDAVSDRPTQSPPTLTRRPSGPTF